MFPPTTANYQHLSIEQPLEQPRLIAANPCWLAPLTRSQDLFLLWITPKSYKNAMLLMLSLVFYTWGEVRYVFIMFVSIALDYTCSNGIENHRDDPKKTKMYLMISVFGNLSILFFFKYTDFAITLINGAFNTQIPLLNLTLPLGISFYTFQTMSYTIDVYRGHLKADRNLIDFGAFVCLFPQLIAGPIVT
jgi:alginate O-acetyltransferase complex protein AlgI